MIKKTPSGYKVTSKDGKKSMGKYKTKTEAGKRLRQVHAFRKKSKS